MSIFKINTKSMGQLKSRLTKDIGNNIKDEIRSQLTYIRPYYEEVADSWILEDYRDGKRILGSEEWSAVALNNGTEFKWTKMPNIDRIKEWVVTDKGEGNLTDEEVDRAAYLVARKLMDEGWDKEHPALWYVDSALMFSGDVTLY